MMKDMQCRIVSAKDYALVQGLPGTGKTSTISVAVMSLLAAGKSVLLTSYTNSAVDNIMLKLKEKGAHMLRLGRAEGVHREMQPYMLGGAKFPKTRSSDLKTIMRDMNLASLERAYELAQRIPNFYEVFYPCAWLQIITIAIYWLDMLQVVCIDQFELHCPWTFQYNMCVPQLAKYVVAEHLQFSQDAMLWVRTLDHSFQRGHWKWTSNAGWLHYIGSW